MSSIQTLRIALLIDDEQMDLFVSRRILVKSGFFDLVELFRGATEALEFLQKNPPQNETYIFCDIFMPVVDGIEFVEKFDKLADTVKEQCALYFITASLDYSKKESVPALVKRVIDKPLSLVLLKEIVK